MNDCYFALRAALTVMRNVDYLRTEADNGLTALAELERAAAPQFVSDEVVLNIANSPGLPECRQRTTREWIAAVRSELGPALGLVTREPTDEQCRAIADEFLCNVATASRGVRTGRAMFDAVSAVMWPKEGL